MHTLIETRRIKTTKWINRGKLLKHSHGKSSSTFVQEWLWGEGMKMAYHFYSRRIYEHLFYPNQKSSRVGMQSAYANTSPCGGIECFCVCLYATFCVWPAAELRKLVESTASLQTRTCNRKNAQAAKRKHHAKRTQHTFFSLFKRSTHSH